MGRQVLALSLAIILGVHAASAFITTPISSLHVKSAHSRLTGGRWGGRAQTAAGPQIAPRARTSTVELRCSADGGAFTKWLEDNGARLACSVAGGANRRGLVTKQDVKAGEKSSDLDAETAVALQLIKEKAEGSKSFYAPWIPMLPSRDTLDVPLFWTEEERSLLAGSKVDEDTKELRSALKEEFDQLMADGWGKLLPSLTLQEYEWATSIVSSRSHPVPKLTGGIALAPMLDFPEHSTQQGGKVELVYEGMFREPRMKFTAGAGIRAGGKACLDYGKSNNALVYSRGIADLKVIRGTYELVFSVSPLDRFRDDKEDILDISGYATEQTFLLDSEKDEMDDVDMLAFLRLVCLSKTDVFLLESVFRNSVWGFMQMPVSKDNEKLMLDTIVGYVEGALDEYVSTDGEDAAAQNDEKRPLRARLAAAAKLAEKKALKKALNLYVDDLGSLDSLEYYQERRLRELNLDRPLDESEIVDPDVPIRPDYNDY